MHALTMYFILLNNYSILYHVHFFKIYCVVFLSSIIISNHLRRKFNGVKNTTEDVGRRRGKKNNKTTFFFPLENNCDTVIAVLNEGGPCSCANAKQGDVEDDCFLLHGLQGPRHLRSSLQINPDK